MAPDNMEGDSREIQSYRESCHTAFWQEVFRAEADYLLRCLKGCRTVLSVGCGPAVVEGMLSRSGHCVTGLDVTAEVLEGAPNGVRTVVGRAEDMPFPPAAFDAVVFVASLQFIEDWRKALAETMRVLSGGGRFIAMLLNPASAFYRDKLRNNRSYVRKMRHSDLQEIEAAIKRVFTVQTEYFLGVNGSIVFESRDPAHAVLYVIQGVRKESAA